MMHSVRIAIALVLMTTGRVATAWQTTDVGDVAPDWETLEGVDGEFYGARDLQAVDVLVICFTSNTCPYSVDYEDRLKALHKRYEGNSAVRLIAINSNATDGDSLKKMIDRAQEKEFRFLYLRDKEQKVATAFGAIYTPEFFVLDRQRKVVYKGAMDDSSKAGEVTKSYVELAIAAALAGESPKVTRTGARGCAIRFPRKRRRRPASPPSAAKPGS